MLSSLSPSNQQFLASLKNITQSMNLAQRRVSTGLKIGNVSDAPDSISLLLQTRANLSSTQQAMTNLGRIKAEVDTGEQTLQNAVTLFDNVQTLGTEGATDTQTASGRADLAQQLDSTLRQLAGLAGTTVEGRFIFSGDSDQVAPYTYNAALANPVSTYQGTASTRIASGANGGTFPIALTAQQIFDSADPTTNVFTTIQSLSTALKNNDSVAIQTAIAGLPKVSAYLNSQLAFYGDAQNNVAAATDFANTLQNQLQTQISNLADADLPTAILELTQAQTQQQAALAMQAQIPRTTLFNFLG